MREHFNFALQSIKHRKLRSTLTVLAVVIGIAAIVALVTVSQGLGNAIEEQFKNLGTDKFYVVAKQPGLGTSVDSSILTEDDTDLIQNLIEVKRANSYLYQKINVVYGREEKYTSVTGIKSDQSIQDVWESQGVTLEQGRWPEKNENGVVTIGSSLAHSTFDKEIFLGSKIEIGEVKYKVVGIMNKIGNEEDDNNIVLIMEEARIIHAEPLSVSLIEVVIKENYELPEVAQEVTRKLKKTHDQEDYEVFIPEQLLAQLGTILTIFQIVLGGIAAISLIVGAVGIMNSMYTNVLERKNEIGILKAIGATPKDIRTIFMVEAGVMGIFGGVLGSIIGTMMALVIGNLAIQNGYIFLKVEINFVLIVVAILFATLIGILAGYLPARDAAKLLPVEALRE
jgi:putative ABC transport system permease protein